MRNLLQVLVLLDFRYVNFDHFTKVLLPVQLQIGAYQGSIKFPYYLPGLAQETSFEPILHFSASIRSIGKIWVNVGRTWGDLPSLTCT